MIIFRQSFQYVMLQKLFNAAVQFAHSFLSPVCLQGKVEVLKKIMGDIFGKWHDHGDKGKAFIHPGAQSFDLSIHHLNRTLTETPSFFTRIRLRKFIKTEKHQPYRNEKTIIWALAPPSCKVSSKLFSSFGLLLPH